MGVKQGPATQGKAIHESKPTSQLSKFNAYRAPEQREAGPQRHGYSVAKAQSIVGTAHK